MTITYCTGCATPLGTTDSSCPGCGAAAMPHGVPTAATTGRQLILGPATAGAIGTGAPAPSPAVPLGGSVRPPRQSLLAAVVSRAGRSGGPVAAGTVTGPVTCDQITATGTGQRLLALVVSGVRLRHRRGAAGSSVGHQLSTEVRRFRVTEVSGRQVDCELVGELAGAHLQPGDTVDVFGRTTRHATVRVRAVMVTSNRSRITARPGSGFVLARIANVVVVTLAAACVIGVAYLLLTR